MFKRVRWLTVGYAAGIGTTLYAARKARQIARHNAPAAIAHRAGTRVRDAVVEGRAAMHEREAELRLRYDR